MKNRGRASSHEIREELDRTRASLDRAFDALGSKLTPAQLFWDGMGVFRSGAGSAVSRAVNLAQQHPLPACVIGLGVGWLMIENARAGRGEGAYAGTYGRTEFGGGAYGQGEYGEYAGGPYPSAAGAYGAGHETGGAVSRVRETASDAVHRVGEVAGRAGERVSESADAVKEKAVHAAATAKEQVVHAAETVREQAGQAVGAVREQAAKAVGSVRDQAVHTAQAVRDGAARVGEQARTTARRAGSGFDHLLREEPLVVGLGALAVGVLAGLMLPATRREDEMLGEVRDRKVDAARDAARETLERGKQAARTVVDRAKESVRETVQDVKQTVRDEVERNQLDPRTVAERMVGGPQPPQGQPQAQPATAGPGQPGPRV